jgi:organic radical activating enzyme
MDMIFFERLLREGKSINFNTVSFGGGEPLVHPEITCSFVKKAKRLDYMTSMTSSGFNVDKTMIETLVDAGLDHFQISIGYNRKSYWSVLDVLSDKIVSFAVNFLVDRRKIEELPAQHERVEESGASYIVYIMPKSMRVETDGLKFGKDEVIQYFKVLTSIKETSRIPIFTDCSGALFTARQCPGSKPGISVSPRGEISFCAFCGIWVPHANSLAETIDRLDKMHVPSCQCLSKFITSDR